MGALRAARRGYRSIADPTAFGQFVALTSTQAEMRRKVRTFLRGITVLMANLDLLNPVRHGRFAFQLASHKLLRYVAPFLLLATLTASGALSGEPSTGFYSGGRLPFTCSREPGRSPVPYRRTVSSRPRTSSRWSSGRC